MVWYAFACVAAAANRPDDALQYLREAINRGYKDADALMADDDLKNLRPNPSSRNSSPNSNPRRQKNRKLKLNSCTRSALAEIKTQTIRVRSWREIAISVIDLPGQALES